MLAIQVVDQSWSHPSVYTGDTGLWAVPLALMLLLVALALVQRRPWVLLGIGVALVVVAPVGSCVFR